VGLLATQAAQRRPGELDPVRYNGATLLGLSGIVVKSHGGSDADGFRYAVLRAVQEVEHDLPRWLARELGGARQHSTSRPGAPGGDDRQ